MKLWRTVCHKFKLSRLKLPTNWSRHANKINTAMEAKMARLPRVSHRFVSTIYTINWVKRLSGIRICLFPDIKRCIIVLRKKCNHLKLDAIIKIWFFVVANWYNYINSLTIKNKILNEYYLLVSLFIKFNSSSFIHSSIHFFLNLISLALTGLFIF